MVLLFSKPRVLLDLEDRCVEWLYRKEIDVYGEYHLIFRMQKTMLQIDAPITIIPISTTQVRITQSELRGTFSREEEVLDSTIPDILHNPFIDYTHEPVILTCHIPDLCDKTLGAGMVPGYQKPKRSSELAQRGIGRRVG
ncbi:hypothetical protein ACFE04_000584 [Oxalis oulophora]